MDAPESNNQSTDVIQGDAIDVTPVEWTPAMMLEVTLNEPDDFLKVRETLTRIGVASRKTTNKLYQSCHILHKQGRYFIVHFKELFLLDGKPSNLNTNAFQSNKNILLSDDGTINTKPQLEIYADDVKCSHGTSTGKLDVDKIFYLRARGLSEASAKKLLMHAFASEVLDSIKGMEDLHNYLEERISKRFE